MMLADHEYLVNNKVNEQIFSKVGSKRKELVVFREALHELQKEPNVKDEVHAKCLQFMASLLKDKRNLKPFGVFDDS